ncbi:MAG: hypothetical protein AB9834_20755 [Lentimicrobium sp.]
MGKVAALLFDVPRVISVKIKKPAEPSGFRPYDCPSIIAGKVTSSMMVAAASSSHICSPPLESLKPLSSASSVTVSLSDPCKFDQI